MGLFDEALGGLEAQAGQPAALYEEVAGLITQAGGVNGLVQQFEQKGLGGVIAGPLAGGSSPTLTADHIVQLLGPEKIAEIASRIGLTEPQVANGIATMLPLVIGHLASTGTAANPAAGDLEGALGSLKSKLFGL